MNIFFLGAGFSKPAGLPLGDGLWTEVLDAAKTLNVYDRKLKYAVYEYIDYYHGKTGKRITEEKINLEEFMSYLDIDRLLMLHGGDYDAPEEILKNLISFVLHNDEKRITDEQFKLYENFVEKLGGNDIIFTFNYDTILEKSLTRKNIPYRHYPFSLKRDGTPYGLALDWKDEVTIYKMHGSINWFDITEYQDWKESWAQREYDKRPPYIVFDGSMDKHKIHRLLDEPFHENDPLKNLFIVDDLDEYFQIYFKQQNRLICDSPFIVAPSYHKLASLSYLSNFWSGFSNVIIGANRIVIAGYSLPNHDEYAKQPLYWYIKNFHRHGVPLKGRKSKLKIVDFQKSPWKKIMFRRNYRFADSKMSDFYFDGLNEQALEFIFAE